MQEPIPTLVTLSFERERMNPEVEKLITEIREKLQEQPRPLDDTFLDEIERCLAPTVTVLNREWVFNFKDDPQFHYTELTPKDVIGLLYNEVRRLQEQIRTGNFGYTCIQSALVECNNDAEAIYPRWFIKKKARE